MCVQCALSIARGALWYVCRAMGSLVCVSGNGLFGMCVGQWALWYGAATISRLLKITGLFYKRALCKRRYSAKETYNLKEPTNRSHPMCVSGSLVCVSGSLVCVSGCFANISGPFACAMGSCDCASDSLLCVARRDHLCVHRA